EEEVDGHEQHAVALEQVARARTQQRNERERDGARTEGYQRERVLENAEQQAEQRRRRSAHPARGEQYGRRHQVRRALADPHADVQHEVDEDEEYNEDRKTVLRSRHQFVSSSASSAGSGGSESAPSGSGAAETCHSADRSASRPERPTPTSTCATPSGRTAGRIR